MDYAKRRPDRMIAAENKAVARTFQNRLHAAPVGFDACCVRIMEPAAMDGTPEICIEFEISAAPLAPHSGEQRLEMLLDFRMCAVEHEPWTVPPAAEGDFVRLQRPGVVTLDEPF